MLIKKYSYLREMKLEGETMKEEHKKN